MILLSINFSELGSNAFEIIIMLLVTAVLAYLIGRMGRVPQKEYDDLLKEKNDIKKQLEELEDEYKNLQERYSALEKEKAELQERYTGLEKDKAELQKSYDHLKNELYDIKNKVSALEEQLKQCREALEQAKAEAAPGDKEGILERIKAKASSINFDRIGRATADLKDDLKLIKGIGKFIEEKLNALGIYTFKQIANFTEEDEEIVNKAIEFFPGRIKRDKWKEQAEKLASKQ